MKKYFGDRVFIAGICGISMSALALMLKGCGIKVLGADINRECKKAEELESLGISVVDPTNLNAIADFNPTVLIYSVAIKTTDAEIVWAKEHNVKVMCRGEALGYVVNKFKVNKKEIRQYAEGIFVGGQNTGIQKGHRLPFE